MPLLTALLVVAPTAASVFDASLAAHGRVRRADVQISVETKLNKEDVFTHARLQFVRPDRLRLTVQEPQQRGLAASRRTYSLTGTLFTAVDENEGEYTQRNFPFPKQLGLSDRLTAALGSPGDAVAVILSDRQLKDFFANYRNLSGFQVSTRAGVIELRRQFRGTEAVFDFNSSSHLLQWVRLQAPNSRLLWSFMYGGDPGSLGAPRVAGMRKVDSLTSRAAPPKYASAEAQAFARKSELAYRNLGSVACQFTDPSGSGSFWRQGSSFRQDMFKTSWCYRGRNLAVKTGNGHFGGSLKPSKVAATLAKLGITVQPMLLQMMEGRNPMGTLLVPESTVRLAGDVIVKGAPCGILEIKSRGLTVSVVVRKSDGLILSTRSAIQGQNGEVALRQESDYQYESVNKSLGASVFDGSLIHPQPLPK